MLTQDGGLEAVSFGVPDLVFLILLLGIAGLAVWLFTRFLRALERDDGWSTHTPAKLTGREQLLVAIVGLPVGLAANAVLLWGFRDVAQPKGPLSIILNVLWLVGLIVYLRRARRSERGRLRGRSS